MKKVILLSISTGVLLVALLMSCKKSSLPNGNTGLSSFSGTWKGTVEWIQVGLCSETHTVDTTTQQWTVDDNGNVNIAEIRNFKSEKDSITWTGTMSQDYDINITSVRITNCFGTPGILTLNLKDKIVSNSNSRSLNTTIDYPLCPPNCLFENLYSVTKQ